MIAIVGSTDRPGIEQLYHDHYRSLVKLASLLLDDRSTCEEIVQDAFVAIHRRGLDEVEPDRVPAYLRSAVLNGARSHLRRRMVRDRIRPVPPPDDGAERSPERGAERSEDHRAILDALRSLPVRQREVLVLRYWMDLSEAEIAATLGVAPGTVKTHAHRGLDALSHRLEALR